MLLSPVVAEVVIEAGVFTISDSVTFFIGSGEKNIKMMLRSPKAEVVKRILFAKKIPRLSICEKFPCRTRPG